jgi:UDP-2-acetamido-2,6-beta-L-arabino-hexul-4-ose reductase
MDVLYIDDLVEEMIQALRGNPNRDDAGFCSVPVHHETTLGYIADNIRSFPEIQNEFGVPQMTDPLVRKLFATYLSYLPADGFIYDLKMNCDTRGSFTEIIRTADRGQFSVNISKPGITKGNHWHHSKNEKFVVVHGTGLIQLRRVGLQSDGTPYPVHDFYVSGDKIQVVQMIPGYTHNIINLSETEDLVTFMWADEAFDPNKPDTYFEKV